MNIFKFEVEFGGITRKCRCVVWERSNHLQGAIRKLYQSEPKLIRITKILE